MSKINWDQKKLKQGAHLCSISGNQEEQLSVLLPFLFGGLQSNEKCICVLSEETKKALVDTLLSAGLDVAGCSGWGQFLFIKPEDSYLKNGKFDPERMIKELADLQQVALRSGFSGLRITGEAKIFNVELPGTERLIEYESKVNDFLRKSRTSALCLYDESVMSRDILRDAIYTHPAVIINGSFCENRYFVAPGIFLSGDKRRENQSYESLKEALMVK